MAQVSAPKLFKTIFAAEFKPYLSFFSVFRTAAAKLTHYPHWETGFGNITVRSFDTRCSVNVQNRTIGFAQDSGDITNEQARLTEVTDVLIPELQLTTFLRLGYRRQYLVPLDITFESLVSILRLKLFSTTEQLQQILPAQVDDLLYRIDCSEGDDKFHIHLGPLRRQEVPKYIDFNAENHLAPEVRDDQLRQIVAGYPEVSMLLDLDFFQRAAQIPASAARDFISKARQRVDELARKFHQYVLSQEVK
jgi:pterin-4a-carbinolamine dehydratase